MPDPSLLPTFLGNHADQFAFVICSCINKLCILSDYPLQRFICLNSLCHTSVAVEQVKIKLIFLLPPLPRASLIISTCKSKTGLRYA